MQQHKPVYPRPDMRTPYVAPRNELEQRITAIWQDVLGIEQVGVHDNLFGLGGDSDLTNRIIARTNEVGLQFTPVQLFQHQTIAELAALIGGTAVDQTMLELGAEQVPPAPVKTGDQSEDDNLEDLYRQ